MKNEKGHTRFMNQAVGFNSGQSIRKHDQLVGEGINQYECGGETVSNICLNMPEVRRALNVPDIPWGWQGIV